MKKILTQFIALIPFAVGSSFTNAIGIDSIIKVTEDGKTTFTVSNNDGYRQFVTVGVSDIAVVDGKLESTPYTKDNIADWSLDVRPARLIINDGQNKKFSVRYVGKQNNDHDRIYQLIVAPSPYYEEGEKPLQSVQMAVGFAPYLIVPAKEDQPMAYDIKYEKGQLSFRNLGNSYLHVSIDGCADTVVGKARNQCVKTAYALSGRDLNIVIDENMQDELKLTLKTNNNTYREQLSINPLETKSK